MEQHRSAADRRSARKAKIPQPVLTLAVVAFWILIWQLLSRQTGSQLLLPGVPAVARRLGELAATAEFWKTIGRSFGRIMAGFVLSFLAGTVLGVLTSLNRILYQLIKVPMNVIEATPVASFVILALMWLTGRNLSVFICFLVVLPMIWTSVDTGLRNIPQSQREVAKVFRFSFSARVKALYIPSVLPYLISTLRVAVGFVWKSGVAAEVIAAPAGTIGRQLHDAKIYLETTDLFAWTLTVIVLSVLLEKLLVWLMGHLTGKLYGIGGKNGGGQNE